MKTKTFLFAITCVPGLAGYQAFGEGVSLQDIIGYHDPLPGATSSTAKEVVTLNPGKPSATAGHLSPPSDP